MHAAFKCDIYVVVFLQSWLTYADKRILSLDSSKWHHRYHNRYLGVLPTPALLFLTLHGQLLNSELVTNDVYLKLKSALMCTVCHWCLFGQLRCLATK